jgi:hypothetical protein
MAGGQVTDGCVQVRRSHRIRMVIDDNVVEVIGNRPRKVIRGM